MAISAWRGARYTAEMFLPQRSVPVPPVGLPVQRVRWSAAGASIAGWYVPAKNRAAVILAHGSSADRSQLNPELRALARAGFGVLAFDWPGYGESGGMIRYGTPERAAFEGAVNWLCQRPEVDAQRIGAFGFSAGGACVIAFSADDPRVAAVAAAGAFTSAIEQTRYEYAHASPWVRAAVLGVAARKVEGGDFRPIDSAAKLKGRPVLLIAGEADMTVPPAMSRELARVTSGQLWMIPDCGHGHYERAVGEAYALRLVRFFETALRR